MTMALNFEKLCFVCGNRIEARNLIFLTTHLQSRPCIWTTPPSAPFLTQMAECVKLQELQGGGMEQQRQLVGTETGVEHMEIVTGESGPSAASL